MYDKKGFSNAFQSPLPEVFGIPAILVWEARH